MAQAEAVRQQQAPSVPAWAWLAAGMLLLVLYAVGYDEGLLLKAFVGQLAEKQNLLHELFHDGRHLLGFPCH
ncbi:MAG TPA: CbtB-domain containing protein [Actinomycetota bacterium]|nr:CbtB-domain containing protein [Actinomycetota bacterium]